MHLPTHAEKQIARYLREAIDANGALLAEARLNLEDYGCVLIRNYDHYMRYYRIYIDQARLQLAQLWLEMEFPDSPENSWHKYWF